MMKKSLVFVSSPLTLNHINYIGLFAVQMWASLPDYFYRCLTFLKTAVKYVFSLAACTLSCTL